MHNFISYMLLFMLMLVHGCSNIIVSQDYPPNTDYAALKVYAWQSEHQEKTGDLRLDNPLLDVRIRRAIDIFLLEKGYQQVSNIQPDFYIAYHQEIYDRVRVDQSRSGFVFGMGSYGYHGGIGLSTGNNTGRYDDSMMVIDIIDSESDEILWRGTATRPFEWHTDPEKLTEQVNETVNKILIQFPPQEH